ncbi:MAG: YlxR family protein [Firmicutes bacterium]|nr:YlxR family protein [Bacillota bacterium]
MKKIPLRTCVVTKEKLPKQELIRIVRTTTGEIEIDLTGKMNGRGAYIKKDVQVLEKAKKSKALDRHLEVAVTESVYQKLEDYISNEK